MQLATILQAFSFASQLFNCFAKYSIRKLFFESITFK